MSTAESFCSVTDADAYNANFGNPDWGILSSVEKEVALRKATAYMVQTYRLRWAGTRMLAAQALDWPRSLVPRRDTPLLQYYDNASVPQEVKDACASLALRASTATLLADQTQRKSSVSVGPISTTYEAGSKVSVTYAEVDAMLRPLLLTGAGQIKLVRT